jgi:glycosyltransferase involved in cell wall biosynthesis
MRRILANFPLHITGQGVTHTFLSLCPPQLEVPLKIAGVVPTYDSHCSQSNLIKAIPKPFAKWIYQFNRSRQYAEWRYLQEVWKYDAAYMWPLSSIDAMKKVKALDKLIFLERINCFTGKAKAILDEAYRRLNLNNRTALDDRLIQEELEQVQLADFIFCPSPLVRDSFLEAGVPADKLISTSYGWSTKRFPTLATQPPDYTAKLDKPFKVVFVGSVCVRKGAHLLIEAFSRANIDGKLILCGTMEPVIGEVCKDALASPHIIHQPHTKNIGEVYRQAHLFAFPSLEEGSPLVTYEAMAHGLPMLVSPMGGEALIRDGIEGIVLPPHDLDAWVEALRSLATSPNLRTKMANASWKRASEFTFEKAANRRANLMLQHI